MRHVQTLLNWILLSTKKTDLKCLERERAGISLKFNDFEFSGDYYLQKMGMAMGKRFAPALANLYQQKFDTSAMNDFSIKPLFFQILR